MSKATGSSVQLAGTSLLTALRKSHWLPFYDANQVRETAKEMGEQYMRLHHFMEISSLPGADVASYATALLLYQSAFWRNRQCVLAYLLFRCEKLQSLYWQVSREGVPEKVRERLSANELRYYDEYGNAVKRYESELCLDLGVGLLPPKEVLVTVRVLEGWGGFQSGKEYLVRRDEVERAVLAGKAVEL